MSRKGLFRRLQRGGGSRRACTLGMLIATNAGVMEKASTKGADAVRHRRGAASQRSLKSADCEVPIHLPALGAGPGGHPSHV